MHLQSSFVQSSQSQALQLHAASEARSKEETGAVVVIAFSASPQPVNEKPTTNANRRAAAEKYLFVVVDMVSYYLLLKCLAKKSDKDPGLLNQPTAISGMYVGTQRDFRSINLNQT